MESRRLSCSFMARAASSMSLKVFGWTGAVWAMTALVPESTFKTALQHGQVTSKAVEFFAISANDTPIQDSVRREADGKHFEQGEHLPAQQENRYNDGHHGNQFSEVHPVSPRF